MLPAPPAPIKLPSSYASLPVRHIKVSYVPTSSSAPTPVILITLNRPEKYNAFTQSIREDLEKVYEIINVDDRVKCIVLTGAGKKAFCSGADLEIGFPGSKSKTSGTSVTKADRDVDHRDGGGRASLAINQCSKPTIAAIKGAAVGVGITMCLPATIRVAYSKARIGFVFNRRGIITEACSSYFPPD